MSEWFVDSNYFVRLLQGDIPEQQAEAARFFHRAATGKLNAYTSALVFFEVYWVISRSYSVEKERCIVLLQGILDMSFLRIEERDLLEESLSLFGESSVQLQDCYNLLYARKRSGDGHLATFDKALLKLANRE